MTHRTGRPQARLYLTDAKIWTDDNYNVIVSTEFMHGGKSGNKNYRIELEIYEYHEILQRIVDGI